MNKLLVICGPTATGKTALGVALAHKFSGEIVSADSRQVYRYMDIGTGKDLRPSGKQVIGHISIDGKGVLRDVSAYDMEGIPLWMYDVVSPNEDFSVSHYKHLTSHVIPDIQKRGKLPILVGGTGLYIDSLFSDMDTIDIPPDNALRKQLGTLPLADLQNMLQKKDVATWEGMNVSDRQNPRRLIRKIEIHMARKNTRLPQEIRDTYDVYKIGLTADLSYLYERIDMRVKDRVRQGALEEIKNLLEKGYTWDMPAMSGLGYRQWKEAFDTHGNNTSAIHEDSDLIKDIIASWQNSEHAYARRQITWFKKDEHIHWIDIQKLASLESAERLVQTWYTKE